jgi:hypothetical protein
VDTTQFVDEELPIDAALVWRGDFFCARRFAFTKGAERMAYGAIVIQEIKKDNPLLPG